MHFYRNFIRSLIIAVAALAAGFHAAGAAAQEGANGQTLKEQLEATNAEFSARMAAPVLDSINNAVTDVDASGILEQSIKVGDRAPDFELPDATGQPVKLSTLLAQGPVVLTWYRGNW